MNFIFHFQVAIPALHVSLGIFTRLFTLFESACRTLDDQHLKEKEKEFIKRAEKIKRLEEKASLFLQNLTWFCLSGPDEYKERIEDMKAEVNRLQLKVKTIQVLVFDAALFVIVEGYLC